MVATPTASPSRLIPRTIVDDAPGNARSTNCPCRVARTRPCSHWRGWCRSRRRCVGVHDERRRHVLELARDHDAFVIDDDYAPRRALDRPPPPPPLISRDGRGTHRRRLLRLGGVPARRRGTAATRWRAREGGGAGGGCRGRVDPSWRRCFPPSRPRTYASPTPPRTSRRASPRRVCGSRARGTTLCSTASPRRCVAGLGARRCADVPRDPLTRGAD